MARFWILGFIGTAASLSTVSAAVEPVTRTGPISGQVVAVRQGEDIVFIQDKNPNDVVVKQDLKAGDVLRTNHKGALSIVFADQTQIRLARNTTLEVKEVSRGAPSAIHVKKGNVWARSPRGRSRLSVTTPSATAAIRGTEWSLSVSADETSLHVESGKVDFFNDLGKLAIQSGEAATAKLGQAPVRTVVVNRDGREQMLYFLPQTAPNSAKPYIKQAYDMAYLGEFDQALDVLQAQEKDGFHEAALYALKARIGFLTGRKTLIKTALQNGLKQDPQNPTLLGLRAEYNANYHGRPDLALVDAKHAASLAPNDADILLALSKIYLERQADLEAMQTINHAISTNPNIAELYVQEADIHLFQNNPQAARASLDIAFKIAPNIGIARLGYGQIHALEGQDEKALGEFLAASASNPGYSPGLLRLAENYGRQGDGQVAKQQLDAADRLDPNSPYTPLYRTALALNHYEGGKAVEGAQEALKRFQARGGVYENLSESRESGSNISRAFRFLELEAWGRYYGDRTFDSFSATSYFDQVLNETPGPFFIRREDTSFNPQNGNDLQQISSFLQGVTLDPLSISGAEKTLEISKESFVETIVDFTSISSDTSNLKRGGFNLQGRNYIELQNGSLPISFSMKANITDIDDNFPDQLEDRQFFETYVGTQISPSDYLTAFVTYRKSDKSIFTSRDILIVKDQGDEIIQDSEDSFGFAFWTHRFSDKKNLVIGGGLGRNSEFEDTIFGPGFNPVGSFFHSTLQTDRGTVLVSANYSEQVNNIDFKIGAEGFWSHDITGTQSFEAFPSGQTVIVSQLSEVENNIHEYRLYSDVRAQLRSDLIVQGQVSLAQRSDPLSDKEFVNYNFGAAYEPIRGHWLRASLIRETDRIIPFTLAPVTVLGLKGSLVPVRRGERIDSKVARWDAQWSDKLFTIFEFQNQKFGVLDYRTPDGDERVGSVVAGQLNQIKFSANYLLGGNWAVSADYTKIISETLQGGAPGRDIPFVPKSTAQAELVWTHPKRISARLSARYTGEQEDSILLPIKGFFTTDATVRWEPFNKRFQMRVGVLNLFANSHEVTLGLPAPGRTLFVSGKARF